MSGEATVQFIAVLRPFDRTHGPRLWRKSRFNYLKYHLDLAAWVLPGELNTTKNCAGCNEGLTTMPGETNVRSIALLSPFDRAQRPVCGEKAGKVT